MPRSNRPRGSRGRDEVPELDLDRALRGSLHVESKRDGSWNVQPMTGANSVKSYICPGCTLEIGPGSAHLVAWRADGPLSEADDLAARRHWHPHCWKIRP